jgi:hypothetical protein
MHDDRQLTAALRSLARVKASEQFTERVMARIPARSPRSSIASYRPIWAAAAAVVVIALLAALYSPRLADDASRPLSVDLSEIAREHAALEREFAELRNLERRSRPTMPVLADDRVEYVVPFNEVDRLMAMPASYNTAGAQY